MITPNRHRSTDPQSACHRVGHVAELKGRTLDLLERFDIELVAGLGIQGPGHRRLVRLRELRNVITGRRIVRSSPSANPP
jgi:hypothetical protein